MGRIRLDGVLVDEPAVTMFPKMKRNYYEITPVSVLEDKHEVNGYCIK
jgi:hypothetical protein